jgi:hypothetical protein
MKEQDALEAALNMLPFTPPWAAALAISPTDVNVVWWLKEGEIVEINDQKKRGEGHRKDVFVFTIADLKKIKHLTS